LAETSANKHIPPRVVLSVFMVMLLLIVMEFKSSKPVFTGHVDEAAVAALYQQRLSTLPYVVAPDVTLLRVKYGLAKLRRGGRDLNKRPHWYEVFLIQEPTTRMRQKRASVIAFKCQDAMTSTLLGMGFTHQLRLVARQTKGTLVYETILENVDFSPALCQG
jgi:hypothetical protein